MMGCGHSKVRSTRKSKGSHQKDKTDESAIDKENFNDNKSIEETKDDKTDCESGEILFDKTEIKNIPLKQQPTSRSGSPLLTQSELSESQQNFFRMLDEKIANGPDYNDNNETLIGKSQLNQMLSDWRLEQKTTLRGQKNHFLTHNLPDVTRNKRSDQKQTEVTKEAICESFDVIPSPYHYQHNNNLRHLPSIPNYLTNYYSERSLQPYVSSINRYNNLPNLIHHQISPNHSPKHYHHQKQQQQPQPQQQYQYPAAQLLSPKHKSVYSSPNNVLHQQLFNQNYDLGQLRRNRDQQFKSSQQPQVREPQPKSQSQPQPQSQLQSATHLVAVLKNTSYDINPVQRPGGRQS